MMAQIAEGALHQARLREPGVEIVAEHVLVEELRKVETSVPRPSRQDR